MTEPADAATKETYEAAIRSFTEAEIALREIIAAVQRFRSASDAVAEAGALLGVSHDSLLATLTTLETTASGLERVSSSLSQATAVIAALDPERFWASFAKLEADTKSSAELTLQAVATSTALLEAALVESSTALGSQIAESGAEQVAATSASAVQLQTRIDAAVVDLTAVNNTATNKIALAVAENRRIATQARAVAVASVAIGATAIAMLVALLLR